LHFFLIVGFLVEKIGLTETAGVTHDRGTQYFAGLMQKMPDSLDFAWGGA
tara:strand:+ start:181 stop:330 length:150 start_codon:yes stop_codon:yes gene_type:complete